MEAEEGISEYRAYQRFISNSYCVCVTYWTYRAMSPPRCWVIKNLRIVCPPVMQRKNRSFESSLLIKPKYVRKEESSIYTLVVKRILFFTPKSPTCAS